MKETTIENVKVNELPDTWVKCINASPDERVDITIRRAAHNQFHRTFDRTTVQKVLHDIAALPVLNTRTPDEIIGYDETGLPS